MIETTLCLLRKGNKILLAKKKRGFGEEKYNGVGGKVESGETNEEAMIRETEEEILVTPTEYEKVGIIEFDEFYKGKKTKVIMHVYIATNWKGKPTESDEAKPEWFGIKDVPYTKMFPDDKHWLPLILEEKKIRAFFEFDEQWNLLNKKIYQFDFW